MGFDTVRRPVEGTSSPEVEIAWGDRACPRCPCPLVRLWSLDTIECQCDCHASQRWLLRNATPPDEEPF